MTTKNTELTESQKLLQDLKSFATTLVEECPPMHRRDPASGACLPMGPIDHTAETRSVNDDQGDLWRGLKDKTVASESKEVALMNADEMDEPISCAEGTTFSFISRTCVPLEQAEQENNDGSAMSTDVDYVEEEVATHQDVVALDPEGRKDPVGFKCPPSQFFDFSRRECIPLNKDTVLASESVDAEFKTLFATYLSGRLAMTSPDPLDGHTHLVTVDENGNGKTSVSSAYAGSESYPHSHDVSEYVVADYTSEDYSSKHFGFVIPKDMWEWKNDEERDRVMSQPSVCCSEEAAVETAAPITTKQRKALPDSIFGVPGKRKFPLDTCARVRNAMARFNQAKGLTAGEKASLRRKILAAAKKCGIKVTNFAKATTNEEFAGVLTELLVEQGFVKTEAVVEKTVEETEMSADKKSQGPCPPWMEWDSKAKKCGKTKGFYEAIKTQGSHSEIIALDPEGRKDTPGFQCPPGSFFDFAKRECVALDPSKKTGTTTSMASNEDSASKVLAPSPAGRPARLPSDCPPNTIWNADREDCVPLDSSKKTKGETETAGDEGLVPAPAGKVKLPSDCPPGTTWDGVNKLCRPLDSSDKNRPSGSSPQNPKSTADTMSVAQLIRHLDEIINVEKASGSREKFKIDAKELPNEAFPPSLVSSTRRALLHHIPGVKDSYDNASIDTARLRNALARVSKLEGYSAQAVEDAAKHLIDHAREVVKTHLGKN